jgi:hypothetical protein
MQQVKAFLVLVLLATAAVTGAGVWAPRPAQSQNPDVLLNVLATGAKKLNIAIPDFAMRGARDTSGLARQLPEVVAGDLRFSGLFSPATGMPSPSVDDPEALRKLWAEAAAAGAHAGTPGARCAPGQSPRRRDAPA